MSVLLIICLVVFSYTGLCMPRGSWPIRGDVHEISAEAGSDLAGYGASPR